MTASTSYPRAYGSYLLLEPLGQGGMSEVELARKAVDDARYVRFMVIKRIHTRHTAEPGFVRMFQDEARINAELQHENIAQVYDFGQVGDEWYIAMEYIPGLDLRGVVRRVQDGGRRLPVPIALRIVSDVLKALQYAHSRVDTYGRPMNIVHRDVNPRNVMLSVRGEVKLIDFGVAKADTRSEQTKGEVIKGKFAYMAPEQIESGAAVDGRADLFAVGLMLYELLAGEHPFAGLREIQIVHRVLAGRIPVLPSVADGADPVALRAAVRRALSMKPDERFPDGSSFREALEQAARAVGGVASTPDLAAFVRSLDPGRAEGISKRLEAWRDMQLPSVVSGTDPGTRPVAFPRPTSAPHPTDEFGDPAGESPLGHPDLLRAVSAATPPMDPPPNPPRTEPRPAAARPGPPTRLRWVLAGGGVAAAGVALLLGLALAWLSPSTARTPARSAVAGAGAGAGALPVATPARRKPTPPESPAAASVPQTLPRQARARKPAKPNVRASADAVEPAAGSESASAPASAPATEPETVPSPPGTSETAAAEAEASETAATPVTTTATAMVFIGSASQGREVWVDGALLGKTPFKARVSLGRHQVRVAVPGGPSWTETIEVSKTRRNYFNLGD